MNGLLDRAGRKRRWYAPDEIDALMETALRTAGLWPEGDPPLVDIERFVEVHLEAIVDYGVDLDDNTLGYTVFDNPAHVVVSRRLTDLATSPTAPLGLRGRWRATLAHEATHLLLHGDLYQTGERTPVQTGTETQSPRKENWREIQANMGMAALLVPRRLLVREVRARIGDQIVFPPVLPDSSWANDLAAWISARFEVSRQLATIRLTERGFVARATRDA
jgi:hypothetical protein